MSKRCRCIRALLLIPREIYLTPAVGEYPRLRYPKIGYIFHGTFRPLISEDYQISGFFIFSSSCLFGARELTAPYAAFEKCSPPPPPTRIQRKINRHITGQTEIAVGYLFSELISLLLGAIFAARESYESRRNFPRDFPGKATQMKNTQDCPRATFLITSAN